jgi:hypothetical protein
VGRADRATAGMQALWNACDHLGRLTVMRHIDGLPWPVHLL